MRGTLAVATREVVERRAILAAALVAGLLPFAAPLIPGVHAGQSAEARDGMALVLAAAFGTGLALLLGGTIVGRDLSEGRLAFDFARPMPGGSIWAGRFLGAVSLVLFVFAIILLPASLAGGGVLSRPFGEIIGAWLLPCLVALLCLIPLAHVASIAFRSRSPWLALDLTGLVTFLLVGVLAGRRLSVAFALHDLSSAVIVLGVLAILALWTASAVQVVSGRTDVRRGHRLQSTVLWSSLLAAVIAFDAYSRFVVSAPPSALVFVDAEPAPRGDWLVMRGTARGRGDFVPAFLFNASSGAWLRLGAAGPWSTSPVLFSADGAKAVWLRNAGPGDPRRDVVAVDLARAELRETTISFLDSSAPLALSADGTRLAVAEDSTLSVYDLEGDRLLASVRVGAERVAYAQLSPVFFADRDHVRVVHASDGLEIDELDIAAKRLVKTGRAAIELGGVTGVIANPAHGRLLALTASGRGEDHARLLDARTGAVLRDVSPGAQGNFKAGFRFLEDGRLVFVRRDENRWAFHSIPVSGDERVYDLGGTRSLAGAEIAPGRISVVTDGTLRILDLDTGAMGDLPSAPKGLRPYFSRFREGGEAQAVGGIAGRIFNLGGAVVAVDPATGAHRVLAGDPLAR